MAVDLNLALVVVSLSIVLSGIVLGFGRALSNKRIERFGMEELIQSIINSAIVGGLLLIVDAISTISNNASQNICTLGNVLADLTCSFNLISNQIFSLLQETIKTLQIIGYYQTMNLHFSSFSIQPFVNLESVSNLLSLHLHGMELALILINLNIQIFDFIFQNMLSTFLVAGLIFRSFFATRKFGGFLISLAIGLYLVYPSFIIMFPIPSTDLNNSVNLTQNFNSHSVYSTVPIIDLNDNYAIAEKLDVLRGANLANSSYENVTVDFNHDLSSIVQSDSISLSKVFAYSIFAPIFSILISIIFIRELTNILGGEIFPSSLKLV